MQDIHSLSQLLKAALDNIEKNEYENASIKLYLEKQVAGQVRRPYWIIAKLSRTTKSESGKLGRLLQGEERGWVGSLILIS